MTVATGGLVPVHRHEFRDCLHCAWQHAEDSLPERVDGSPAIHLRLERNLDGSYRASSYNTGTVSTYRYRTLRPYVKSALGRSPAAALHALARMLE